MNEGFENHESILVQSVRAQNRACFVIATFLMRKYQWSLVKTLEFLNSRRPELEIRPSFLSQLHNYERRLYERGIGPKTKRWNELADSNVPDIENDELILRNTYMNSQQGPFVDLSIPTAENSRDRKTWSKLLWRDKKQSTDNPTLCEENKDEEDLINIDHPPKQMNHYLKPATNLKSKLKNSKLHDAQKRQNFINQPSSAFSQQDQNLPKTSFTLPIQATNQPIQQTQPRQLIASQVNQKTKFISGKNQSVFNQSGNSTSIGHESKANTSSQGNDLSFQSNSMTNVLNQSTRSQDNSGSLIMQSSSQANSTPSNQPQNNSSADQKSQQQHQPSQNSQNLHNIFYPQSH